MSRASTLLHGQKSPPRLESKFEISVDYKKSRYGDTVGRHRDQPRLYTSLVGMQCSKWIQGLS